MTTHRYKAAVIIPSRGGAKILHYPLDALTEQTEKDFQVIVVLDGDIDNSEAVVDRYIAEGKLNLTKMMTCSRPPIMLLTRFVCTATTTE